MAIPRYILEVQTRVRSSAAGGGSVDEAIVPSMHARMLCRLLGDAVPTSAA